MKVIKRLMLAAVFVFTPFAWFAGPVQAQSVPSSSGFLDSWSFSETNWLSNLGYSPLSFTNIYNRGGGDGNALIMDTGGDPAYLIYNTVESDSTTNLSCPVGTISLWFAANWSGTNAGGTGPGEWSRFVEAGTNTTDASIGWFSFYLSPDGSTVYLAGQTNNGNGAVYLYAPVTITNSVWNNLVVTYGPTNSVFYFNGVLITNSPNGVAYYPGSNILTNGFSIGSSAVDGQSQVHGLLDDVLTYNKQLDGATVNAMYQMYYILYYGAPPVDTPQIITNAPSAPAYIPSFDAISGPGFLQFVTNLGGCATSSNIWLTNMAATIGPSNIVNFTFTIGGGFTNVPYDVFGTAALANPATAASWSWLGQGYHCGTYTLSIPSNTVAFLLLGQPTDTDGDGLTDAYEILVSKTNPNNAYSRGDGIPDAWAAMHGLFGTNIANLDPDLDGLLNKQEYLWGTQPLVSEGTNIWVASPAGISGVP